MNIEKVQVSKSTKYIISGLDDLDPITVSLEDVAPKKCKLTISCSNDSWTAALDDMGKDNDICNFVSSTGNLALTWKMAPDIRPYVDDFKNLNSHARAFILTTRRKKQLAHSVARECFEATNLFSGEENPTETDKQVAQLIFGPEWIDIVPSLPNPDYRHLNQIINVVHEALVDTKPPAH